MIVSGGAGAGVAEERIGAGAGVSVVVLSTCAAEVVVKDIFECKAVARIAFIRSMLFCCFLGSSVGLSCEMMEEASPASVSRFLETSPADDESAIGQTKPVRGV